MIDNALLERIRNLEPADRLELIGVVWDSLSPTDLPLTDDERDLLDARLADMESNPDDQSSWADVKKRLEKLP
jgi:putative addiction module component (TIGR02574 family)